MTPQDHNKALGIMHLIYGGFQTLVMLFVFIFFVFIGGILSSMPRDADMPPAIFFALVGVVVMVMYLLLSLPSLLAGYAMLKRKSWARTAAFVSAIVASLSFPFGTALAIYSFWFMFGADGKRFYDEGQPHAYPRATLGDAYAPYASNLGWDSRSSRSRQDERAYVPPPQPPDWRDNS